MTVSTDRIELLRRMPIFGGLQPRSLELILGESSSIAAPSGTPYFREGEPGDSLFVMEVGEAIVQRQWRGQTLPLGRLGPGDCFGEMALIDFLKRSATVVADTDCIALRLPTLGLRKLFQRDVEQYAMIMMNMGREVSRRLRRTDDQLLQLQYERGLFIESPPCDL